MARVILCIFLSKWSEVCCVYTFCSAPESAKIRPLAYIKAVDSRYIEDDAKLEDYFSALARTFDVDLDEVEVYISGASERLEAASKCRGKVSAKKNLWSLAPLLDVGLCLDGYENGAEKDCLIASLDSNGFVSSVLLERGGRCWTT